MVGDGPRCWGKLPDPEKKDRARGAFRESEAGAGTRGEKRSVAPDRCVWRAAGSASWNLSALTCKTGAERPPYLQEAGGCLRAGCLLAA